MWYSHRAPSSFLDQSVLLSITVFCKICFISLLETSTCPLVRGWKGVAMLWRMPYSSSNVLNNLFQKLEPSLFIISLEVPNLENIVFFKNVVTLLQSLVGRETASTHFHTLVNRNNNVLYSIRAKKCLHKVNFPYIK